MRINCNGNRRGVIIKNRKIKVFLKDARRAAGRLGMRFSLEIRGIGFDVVATS